VTMGGEWKYGTDSSASCPIAYFGITVSNVRVLLLKSLPVSYSLSLSISHPVNFLSLLLKN
jgi:hypothetical protein